MSHPFQQLYFEKRIGKYIYNSQSLLGKGSYSTVYFGQNEEENSQVAIKIIENHLLRDEYIHKLITQECEIMKSLSHPNIVNLYEVLHTTNHTYIIQEYCNQQDLRKLLSQKISFSEEEAIIIFKQILEGFKELLKHRIIHRDMKPANILINNNIFKIADFGFALNIEELNSNIKTAMAGTPLYMSPQCLRGEPYGTKNDIWSLGIILYELIYGDVPWPANSKFELMQAFKTIPLRFNSNKKISPILRQFLQECLRLEESERIDWEEIYRHPLFKKEKIERGMVFSRDNHNKLVGIEYCNNKPSVETYEKKGKSSLSLFEFSEKILIINQNFEKSKTINSENLAFFEYLLSKLMCDSFEFLSGTENQTEDQRKNFNKQKKGLLKTYSFFADIMKRNQRKFIKIDTSDSLVKDNLIKVMKDLIRELNHQIFMNLHKEIDNNLYHYLDSIVCLFRRIIVEHEVNHVDIIGDQNSLLEFPEKLEKVSLDNYKKMREFIYEIN